MATKRKSKPGKQRRKATVAAGPPAVRQPSMSERSYAIKPKSAG